MVEMRSVVCDEARLPGSQRTERLSSPLQRYMSVMEWEGYAIVIT